jgi:hypothetical protein
MDAEPTVVESSYPSTLKDYLKKPLSIPGIPQYVWYALVSRHNSFWLKCQNGMTKKGYMVWLKKDISCPYGSNCEIFCRACVDKYTPLAVTNKESDDLHVFSNHWNEIQHFPIFIGLRKLNTYLKTSKSKKSTETTNKQKPSDDKVSDDKVSDDMDSDDTDSDEKISDDNPPPKYRGRLQCFMEDTVCPKIFPDKKERDEMKRDPVSKGKIDLIRAERAKAKAERAMLKKAEYEMSKGKSEDKV